MAPIPLQTALHEIDVADLKAKYIDNHVEVEAAPKGPVPDDYMYDFKYNHHLPTTTALEHEVPMDVDAPAIARIMIRDLELSWSSGNPSGFIDSFLEYGVWRDKLAFSWDYRTFNWRENISRAACDIIPAAKVKNVRLLEPAPIIHRPYPDLAYLQFTFAFDTELANAHAVLNAVLTRDGWRIWTLHTVIDGLHQFPEKAPEDGHMTGSIGWEAQRRLEDNEIEPDVLIIGAGQNGLALSARLKALSVPNLIIERAPVVGQVWRGRYEYLSLHFPHWADHFPYFPFPERWPTYTPAQKLGIFMEWYASALDLSVWTSSVVVSAAQDKDKVWTVQVNKDGQLRTLYPKHVVMATSLCGVPTTPVVPGMDAFEGGVIRHSTAHDSSRDFVGKKVLVVGTSSSGFDTAYDCARRGIDVTLLQRSPTYIMSLTHSVPRIIGAYEPKNGVRPDIEAVDRLWFSMPNGPSEELGRRNAQVLEDLDRELLDGLHAKGLRTWRGQRETGNATLGQTRNGGFYFDAGACEQIINGSIKVEQGFVEEFTRDKVILSGGRERDFDLVVFATGFSNAIDSVRAALGEEIASQCGPIWGVDEEGEFRSAYKESGFPNLWIFVGYLPYTRFHSKRLALRLKALLEGVSPAPYKV